MSRAVSTSRCCEDELDTRHGMPPERLHVTLGACAPGLPFDYSRFESVPNAIVVIGGGGRSLSRPFVATGFLGTLHDPFDVRRRDRPARQERHGRSQKQAIPRQATGTSRLANRGITPLRDPRREGRCRARSVPAVGVLVVHATTDGRLCRLSRRRQTRVRHQRRRRLTGTRTLRCGQRDCGVRLHRRRGVDSALGRSRRNGRGVAVTPTPDRATERPPIRRIARPGAMTDTGEADDHRLAASPGPALALDGAADTVHVAPVRPARRRGPC